MANKIYLRNNPKRLIIMVEKRIDCLGKIKVQLLIRFILIDLPIRRAFINQKERFRKVDGSILSGGREI